MEPAHYIKGNLGILGSGRPASEKTISYAGCGTERKEPLWVTIFIMLWHDISVRCQTMCACLRPLTDRVGAVINCVWV